MKRECAVVVSHEDFVLRDWIDAGDWELRLVDSLYLLLTLVVNIELLDSLEVEEVLAVSRKEDKVSEGFQYLEFFVQFD